MCMRNAYKLWRFKRLTPSLTSCGNALMAAWIQYLHIDRCGGSMCSCQFQAFLDFKIRMVWKCMEHVVHGSGEQGEQVWHTVDGRNPANQLTGNLSHFSGFYTSQVVQDFFHQQYEVILCTMQYLGMLTFPSCCFVVEKIPFAGLPRNCLRRFQLLLFGSLLLKWHLGQSGGKREARWSETSITNLHLIFICHEIMCNSTIFASKFKLYRNGLQCSLQIFRCKPFPSPSKVFSRFLLY